MGFLRFLATKKAEEDKMNDTGEDQGRAEEEDGEEPVVLKMKVVSHAVL